MTSRSETDAEPRGFTVHQVMGNGLLAAAQIQAAQTYVRMLENALLTDEPENETLQQRGLRTSLRGIRHHLDTAQGAVEFDYGLIHV